MATERNIKMVRGDTLSFGMEFTGLDQDLDTAYFTARDNYNGTILFQKSLANGITKVETGKYRVRVAPADTASAISGMYVYDLQIGVNGDIFTLMRGILELQHDVTES